jgi:hypothetical protein
MKQNCWEVKKCGRCLSGAGDAACPVCKETRAHGIHGGVNGGRACWTISHAKCDGTTQGAFGAKFRNCKGCDFYNMVREEEKGSFQLSATILAKLGK